MKLFKWGKKTTIADYTQLESIFEKRLRPVKPPKVFIDRLRYQIYRQYQPIRQEVQEQKQRTLLLIGASLVGGLLTLVMGIRIVMTLLAAIAMLTQWRRPMPAQAAPVRQGK